MEKVKNLALRELFDVQISGRSAVDSIFKDLNGVHHLVLDFSSIEFISRSAAHQLLSNVDNLQDKMITVETVALHHEVSQMIKKVRKSIKNPKKLATYVEFLSFANDKEMEEYVLSF